jgi:hypothetical protein
MMRVRLNAIVDIVAFPSLLLSLFCGIITWKVLPSGSDIVGPARGAGRAVFLGLQRGLWRDIHIYAGLVLAGLVVLHLVLHWRWILCIPRLFSRPTGKSACPADVVGPDGRPGDV